MLLERSLLWRSRLLVALGCLTMLGLQGWIEWDARTHQVQETESSLQNLANSLMRQAEDSIEIADTSVFSVVERLETAGTSPEALAILDRNLAAQAAAGTRYRAITVLNANGDWIAGSSADTRGNYADREFFVRHRDHPDRGSYLGQPLLSRVTGQWIITTSRRFDAPDGAFAGVVNAVIDLSYFVNHYAKYDLGTNSSIILARTDGVLLARYPPIGATIGKNFSNATVFAKLREGPAGSFTATAVLDGIKRFAAYRRSDRYDLLAIAAASEDHALASWRADAALHMAITLVLSIALGFLGLHLVRQVRRIETAEQAVRMSEAFLDRASRLAGVGGWELDLATGEGSWSAEILAIYGLEHDEMPSPKECVDFFAPEARPVVMAAFERCKDHGDGWDLELPFDRADSTRLWVRSVGSAVVENGVTVRVHGAMQDITDRVVERLALEAANARVTLATDSGGIGIWDWDIVTNTLVWDSWMYRLYGMERPDGRQTYDLWLDHLHPDDRSAAEQAIRDSIDGVKPFFTEFRVIWADGSVHHIRGSGQVTRDAAGRAIRMLGANWDVTELSEQNILLAQAEREAAAAAAQYRLLADNSSDMILIIDRERKCRFVSPASRELLGFAPEELIGTSPMHVIHPDDAPRVSAILTEMFAGRDFATSTHRGQHRDGHAFWVDAVFKLLRDPATGEPMEIIGSIRDVTERVAAEAALRESEGRYRLLLESGVAEAFYMLDPNGIVETWNAGAERIKGWPADEIIGRNFSTFFTPEDVARGEPERLLAMARDTGQFTVEGWRVRKDGSRFLSHAVIDAIREKDGTLRGFAKVARDVTDRRIEEEQRAIILEATPTGIIIVDEAGTITLANSQVDQIFGYPKGVLVGQKLEILVPETMRAAHDALCAGFAAGGSEREMAAGRAVAGRRQDGTEVLIEIMLRPVKTPRGAIVVASLRDVTERLRLAAEQQEKERQERLAIETANANLDRLARHLAKARDAAEKASAAKTRFLAGMSHELRTPLNGILGYARLLHMEGELNATQAARVDAMLEAGKHLLGMIARVLDMSEIEAEHVELSPVTFDLLPVAEACMDLIRPAAEAKGLALRIDVAPGTPRELTADVTRLRQVLLNLLGNAAKFTRDGRIVLRLRPRADGLALRIEVADTGAGIPADQRQLLFQDFERLDTEATRGAEGAGLGLALSARLAALMGGWLGHEDNPGGGSVFWLDLPLTATAAAPESGVPLAPASKRALHVLVVDDAEMNRDVAGSFLRAAGHRVTLAEGGAEAVAAVADTDFDVVLMDVRMPGMDGLEATRRIRALEGRRGRVPIIALTAQTFAEQVAACRAAGMDSHVGKPFDMEDLLAAVARAADAGPAADAGGRPADTGGRPADAGGRPADAGGRAGDAGPAAAAPSVVPAPSDALATVESGLPVIDEKQFALTTRSLTREMAAEHVRTLMDIAEALLLGLNEAGALLHAGSPLSDTAHTLAGSAGLFGFKRLAAKVRELEQAIHAGAADVPALAKGLRAAVLATRTAIGDRVQLDVAAAAD